MSNSSSPLGHRPASSRHKQPLTLEQLEARMLMALNVLDTQLQSLSDTETFATSSIPLPEEAQSTKAILRSLSVRNLEGTAITSGGTVQTSASSVQLTIGGLDQLGRIMSDVPRTSWIISSSARHARATVQLSGNTATINFNRLADYQITVKSGKLSHRFTVRYDSATPVSLGIFNTSGNQRIADAGSVNVTGRTHGFSVAGLSPRGNTLALSGQTQWTVLQTPSGGSASFQSDGLRTTVTFDRAGQYVLRAANGDLASTVRVNVVATLTSITVDPGTGSVAARSSLQLQAQGLDQFGRPLDRQPQFSWTATGGTISNSGLYTAGANAGNFQASARASGVTGTAAITVQAAQPQGGGTVSGLTDANLRNLVSTFYADNSITRQEMIQILRSSASDQVVSAAELADLRFLVSSNSNIQMPAHVRGLASNLVNDNPANLRFRGQAAGNLRAGSSGTLMNNLVDKWFLGADLPTVTSSSISYRAAVGSLFVNAPSLNDSRQGQLGDCYFLASLVSIAERNQSAIRNMFVDNEDGTFTVRFFGGSLGMFWQGSLISAGFTTGAGVADYVTVDRNLPTYSNGGLAYSGYGRSALNASTTLWLALAEKAYAQWNETGKSGRNGTNTYTAIEGGWMSNVNAQVLGYNSTYYSTNSTSKQVMINALSAGHAVTLGTTSNASAGGLVGSHAYVVTAYNAASDSFTLYNPWSTQHPTPLNWSQLQGHTSAFVIANPSGSVNSGQSTVRSEMVTTSGLFAPVVESFTNQIANDQAFAPEQIDELFEPSLAPLAADVSQNQDHQSFNHWQPTEVVQHDSGELLDHCEDLLGELSLLA